MISALRMTSELDAGPVYMKRPLSLGGSAQEIFERGASIIVEMIEEIVKTEPVPVMQRGESTTFLRRTPNQSSLPLSGSPVQIFDFIRMLDAETYPKAFIDWGDFRIELDHATHANADTIEARAVIRRKIST